MMIAIVVRSQEKTVSFRADTNIQNCDLYEPHDEQEHIKKAAEQ